MSYHRATKVQILTESLPMTLLVSVFFIQPALAYVDPSTGSYMLQLAMGCLFGSLFSVKAFLKRFATKQAERKD